MIQLDIEKLIGEATAYDKKQNLEVRRPRSWCKSISAFANGDGGVLIFGLADDGTVVGLEEPEAVADKISEIIKARMDPIPEFSLRFEKVEDKILVILDIRKGNDTPTTTPQTGGLRHTFALAMKASRQMRQNRNVLFLGAGTLLGTRNFLRMTSMTSPFPNCVNVIRNGQERVSKSVTYTPLSLSMEQEL